MTTYNLESKGDAGNDKIVHFGIIITYFYFS